MVEHRNPTDYLEDLAHVFQTGASDPAGLTIDPDLCLAFAEGLADVGSKIDRLVAYVADEGCVRTVAPPPASGRAPAERRTLARLATALDPDGRVLSFPIAPVRRIAVTEGGSAA